MFDTVFGLPLHPLVVHATVVVVPAAAVAVVLAAVWPRFRRWAGPLPWLLSVAGLVLVPVTTSSGETLQEQVPDTTLIERHTQMGEGLTVWVIVLALGATGLLYVSWRERRAGGGSSGLPRALVAATVVVALVGAIASVVQVIRIGHSGATAAWSNAGAVSRADRLALPAVVRGQPR